MLLLVSQKKKSKPARNGHIQMLQGSPAFAPPDQPEDYMVLSNEYEKLQNRPPVVIEKEDKRADFLEELGERGTNIEELM